MNSSQSFIQKIFAVISLTFSISFSTLYFEGGLNLINSVVGLFLGCAICLIVMSLDSVAKKYSLKNFNLITMGLLFGYLMAKSILFLLGGMLDLYEIEMPMAVRLVTYLSAAYFGMMFTARSAEEIHLSIPFVEFKQSSQKKKDILMDLSILEDPRIIDLASTGLLDNHLILPRFAIKELHEQAESIDQSIKTKARQGLEVIKKLESMPSINLRYIDTDFPEIKEPIAKLVRLARLLDTHIITSDINRIQQSTIEEIRILNSHMLSNALKPIKQAGETINIKIQKTGNDARQGVGYLEDGTMVVVNGGGNYVGKTIKAYVLSVKRTTSGRMIFCNAAEDEVIVADEEFALASHESALVRS
jgi:uncharacterized protein YacL